MPNIYKELYTNIDSRRMSQNWLCCNLTLVATEIMGNKVSSNGMIQAYILTIINTDFRSFSLSSSFYT